MPLPINSNCCKGKIKSIRLHKRVQAGTHLPLLGLELVGGEATNVCDAWPVRRQTYSYVPSRKASLPIGWYQIILLGDRGTCVLTSCPGSHSTAGRPGFEPATQIQHPTAMPPSHNDTQVMIANISTTAFVQ